MASFLAAIWNPHDPQGVQASERLRRDVLVLHPGAQNFDSDGLLVANLSTGPRRALLLPIGGNGAVFGTLFRRSASLEPAPCLTSLSSGDADALHASSGRALLTGYWGSYIAFVRKGPGHEVIADPASSIPCFHFRQGPLTLLFSHLERCPASMRRGLTLNRRFVLNLLAYDKIQNGETGLNEVRELAGGQCLSITPEETREKLIWDPRDFAKSRHEGSPAEAADALARVTRYVTGSWGACYPKLALNLSGGLDSAIVAACLTHGGERSGVRGVHFALMGGDPSEAAYARAVAASLGMTLEEIDVDPGGALPSPDACPPSVRPYREFLGQGLPASSGANPGAADPTFTGQGGDHLFLETRSPMGFADYLMAERLGPSFLRELLAAARLSGVSVWRVLQDVLPAIVTGSENPAEQFSGILSRKTRVNRLAHDRLDAAELLPVWARRPEGCPPAKFAQVVSLVHLFQIRSALTTSGTGALIHPLISQPLIEFCLQTPTYVLCAGGWPRGLARQAMKGLIPEAVRLRRSKGDASRFYIEQLVANHALLTTTLLDGELVAGGYIDRKEAEAFLEPAAFRTQTFGRMLLVYYVIECWLRRWKSELRCI